MALSTDELNEIITDADENYNGNMRTAIAAKIHGKGVVLKCGNKEPVFSDKAKINAIKGQITKLQKNVNQAENSKN